MKLIYSEQALESLEEVIDFLMRELKLPLERVIEIKNNLLDRAEI